HGDEVRSFRHSLKVVTINHYEDNSSILIDLQNLTVSIHRFSLPRVARSAEDDAELRLHRVEDPAELGNVGERGFPLLPVLALADEVPSQLGAEISYRPLDRSDNVVVSGVGARPPVSPAAWHCSHKVLGQSLQVLPVSGPKSAHQKLAVVAGDVVHPSLL